MALLGRQITLDQGQTWQAVLIDLKGHDHGGVTFVIASTRCGKLLEATGRYISNVNINESSSWAVKQPLKRPKLGSGLLLTLNYSENATSDPLVTIQLTAQQLAFLCSKLLNSNSLPLG